jgi:hypothetical protein
LINTALTTQARVDETNLKRDKTDINFLKDMLERVREAQREAAQEEANNPPVNGHDPV